MAVKYRIVMSMALMIVSTSISYAEDGVALDPALVHSVNGINAYQKSYEAMMNNSVNTKTPGYKEIGIANVQSDNQIRHQVFYRFTQGTPVKTGGPLDLLIEGPGFFMLQCPWGVGYTRDGRFALDERGQLVTFDNRFPVLGEDGVMYLTPGNVQVTQSGIIMNDAVIIDIIKVAHVEYPERLRSFNGSVFYFNDYHDEIYSDEDTHYTITQGAYESSNVDMTGQLSKVPIVKNMYDANTRAAKMILKSLSTGISIGNPQ